MVLCSDGSAFVSLFLATSCRPRSAGETLTDEKGRALATAIAEVACTVGMQPHFWNEWHPEDELEAIKAKKLADATYPHDFRFIPDTETLVPGSVRRRYSWRLTAHGRARDALERESRLADCDEIADEIRGESFDEYAFGRSA